MEERKITVVIPTYNRFECMKYFFENCFMKYTGELFTFEIHDSSEDDRVKEYIDATIGDSPILKYFRYDPSINADVKVMNAILNVQTEFVYLIGDGTVVNYNLFEKWLCEISFFDYSLIFWRPGNKNEIHYLSHVQICRDFFDLTTLFGVTLVRSDVIKAASSELSKYRSFDSPFIYVSSIFEGLAKKPGPCIYAFLNIEMRTNPYKKYSGWRKDGQAVEVFCYKLYESLKLLPEEYDILNYQTTANPNFKGEFKFRRILRMRTEGNFTWSQVKKYKYYIKKMIPNVWSVYLAAVIPVWFLKPIYFIYDRIKRKS